MGWLALFSCDTLLLIAPALGVLAGFLAGRPVPVIGLAFGTSGFLLATFGV